jgi:hypothetical protein
MVEQGLSLTVIDAPHPLDEPGSDPRRDFYAARRIWLGGVSGTDWLHEAIEREFGPAGGWFYVESERRSTHAGAGGEIAIVLLVLLIMRATDSFAKKFGERLGERTADDFYDWVTSLARDRRDETYSGDPPPDFRTWDDVRQLAAGIRGELAELLRVDEGRLEVLSAERRDALALSARYRDVETGREYTAEVGRDEAMFRRADADPGTPVT